jgi:hypothetical protein
MRTVVAVACLAGCTSSGSLDLELSLPANADLRPTGMSTITVLAQAPATDPTENTAVIDKTGHFVAGDVPVGKDIQVDVLLRDFSSRLVGVGEAPQLVDVSGTSSTRLSIPVRKPFVYAASGSQLYTYDPSLDPRDAKFQGVLTGLTAPQLAVSVGGELLVVASTNQLQIVDTSTHMVKGSPISIPGMIHDVASVPGAHKVAVGHASGVAVVDLDAQTVQNTTGPAVDKITVGLGLDGKLAAFGLVGRVVAPAGPFDNCTGSSQMVTVPIDAPPASVQATPLTQPTSDLAATPNAPGLYATLPCAGKVVRLDGELSNDVPLERAAVLTVAGGRVWAAGSHVSTAVCLDNNGKPTPCGATATAGCSATSGPSGTIAYANPGAHLIIESIPLAGGTPIQIDLPERRETMLDKDDIANEHAQVLHTLSLAPLDLVALPGGEYVALVTTSTYFTTELVLDTGVGTEILLPCLIATTGDWELVDVASASVAERVRTQCALTYGPSDSIFKDWICDDPAAGEKPAVGTFLPTSVGALFGAR